MDTCGERPAAARTRACVPSHGHGARYHPQFHGHAADADGYSRGHMGRLPPHLPPSHMQAAARTAGGQRQHVRVGPDGMPVFESARRTPREMELERELLQLRMERERNMARNGPNTSTLEYHPLP